MDDRIDLLEQEIAAIKERNARVEADKAWEVSHVRSVVLPALNPISAIHQTLVAQNKH